MIRVFAVLFSLSFLWFDWDSLDSYNIPKLFLMSLSIVFGALSIKKMYGNIAWFIFLSAMLVCSMAGADPMQSVMGGRYAAWETMLLALACWIAFEIGCGHSDRDSSFSYTSLAIVGLIGSIYLISQKAGFDFVTAPLVGRGQPVGAMGNPAWSAILSAMMIPIALRMGMKKDAVFLVAVPIIIIGTIASGSRGAILAALVGFLWCSSRIVKLKYIIAAAVLFCSMTMLLYGNHSSSDLARMAQNKIAIAAWMKNPWLGCGPATGMIWFLAFRTQELVGWMGNVSFVQVHSHNLVTNILATQGIVGILAWSLLIVFGWRAASFATRGVMLSVAAFGMFQPIPHMAYSGVALLVGIDYRNSLGRGIGILGKTMTVAISGAILFVSAKNLMADRIARDGYVSTSPTDAAMSFLRANEIAPWEPYYSTRAAGASLYTGNAQIIEKARRAALKSLFYHRGNQLAYMGAVRSLQASGDMKSAVTIAIAAKQSDPLGRMWEVK